MPDLPASPDELAAVTALVNRWAAGELETNPLLAAVEFIPEERRWLVRLRGEDKAVITVWLTLRERSLHFETGLIPAPEENMAECFEYLLRVNNRLAGMAFCIGTEDAVYLNGQIQVRAVDAEELDRIIGSSWTYIEQHFRTALSIGFASRVGGPRG